MGKSELKSRQMNCPSCGAPVVSEICAYCGMVTGLDTAGADMEYPVLECKAAVVNFWNFWFPMIFAAAFGFAGLVEYIVKRIKKELKAPIVKTIATGGFSNVISKEIECIDVVDKLLTLKGLKYLYDLNTNA